MNADGSRSVAVRISLAASLPSLSWIATGLVVGGVLVLAAGLALSGVPARRAVRQRWVIQSGGEGSDHDPIVPARSSMATRSQPVAERGFPFVRLHVRSKH